MFQGLHQVSRHQRRSEEAEGRKPQPLRIPVYVVRGLVVAAVVAVCRRVRQRLLPSAVHEPPDGQRGRVAQDQTLADPTVDRRAQQPVRRAHGTVGVVSVAHGLVRYLLRNVLQISVGTVGLLLAATIHAEAVIDHIDGALHDETGTVNFIISLYLSLFRFIILCITLVTCNVCLRCR